MLLFCLEFCLELLRRAIGYVRGGGFDILVAA
jgi:hypothetical protein